MKLFYAFLIAAVLFLAIDSIWLKTMNKLYRKHLGALLRPKPNLVAAGVFYLIYMLGLTALVFNPAFAANSMLVAAIHGVIFGIVAYGTYDLTNQATLKNWPTFITVVDVAWGGFLTGLVATITFWVL